MNNFNRQLFLCAGLFFSGDCKSENRVVFNAFELGKLSPEECLEQCFFQLPKLLEKAKLEQLEVAVVVSSKLDGYGPLDKESMLLEPQRVAATWATVYKKFFNTDVEIFTDLSDEPSLAPIVTDVEPDDKAMFDHGLEDIPDKKRFLITGGAGFIGSYMTRQILGMGHQVIVMDNYSCCRRDNLVEHSKNKDFKMVEHDATQSYDIAGRLDYVVHLASQPSPEYYYKRPIETLRSGLVGTKIALELAKAKGARFLLASTSEVYGDPEVNPQPESYAGNVSYVGPRSQYDESKRGAEVLAKLYFELYGVDVRIARIFNTYGPNMMLNDGRVVTNFIRSILDKKPVTIYGSGKQTRSFSFVSDTVDGLLKLLFCNQLSSDDIYGRVFNVGNDTEMTINDLASSLSKISKDMFDYKVECKFIDHFDYTDPKVRQPDLSRARHVLGYKTNMSLEEGLRRTISYFVR